MTLLYDDKYEADLSDFDALFEYLYLSCKFFFAVLSLTTFSSNDWQNTTIDIIQWRYCVHPTLNRYEQEIPLNPCDKERGSTRVWATGSQDVHRRMILPRILCLDARCHHIFGVSFFHSLFSIIFLLLPWIWELSLHFRSVLQDIAMQLNSEGDVEVTCVLMKYSENPWNIYFRKSTGHWLWTIHLVNSWLQLRTKNRQGLD